MPEGDYDYIVYQLPLMGRILEPDFFNRVTFPLPILHQISFLQDANPVAKDVISLFNMEEPQPNDVGLQKQFWFLLFCRDDTEDIQDNYSRCKELKEDMEVLLL